MPTRMIRDGILSSERVNALSERAELFYRRLMSVVDDHGRFSANLALLRAACYPLKLDAMKEDAIKKSLAECQAVGLVLVYEVSGKPFLQMDGFGQRVQSKSKFPEPNQGLPKSTVENGESPGKTALGGGGGVDEGEGGVAPPPCPQQAIVDLYHATLPTLRRVKDWSEERQGYLRARWRESPDRQNLDWWQGYFEHVGGSDWLMGRRPGGNGRPFDCDLEWLVRPTNFVKVLEGKYDQ